MTSDLARAVWASICGLLETHQAGVPTNGLAANGVGTPSDIACAPPSPLIAALSLNRALSHAPAGGPVQYTMSDSATFKLPTGWGQTIRPRWTQRLMLDCGLDGPAVGFPSPMNRKMLATTFRWTPADDVSYLTSVASAMDGATTSMPWDPGTYVYPDLEPVYGYLVSANYAGGGVASFGASVAYLSGDPRLVANYAAGSASVLVANDTIPAGDLFLSAVYNPLHPSVTGSITASKRVSLRDRSILEMGYAFVPFVDRSSGNISPATFRVPGNAAASVLISSQYGYEAPVITCSYLPDTLQANTNPVWATVTLVTPSLIRDLGLRGPVICLTENILGAANL